MHNPELVNSSAMDTALSLLDRSSSQPNLVLAPSVATNAFDSLSNLMVVRSTLKDSESQIAADGSGEEKDEKHKQYSLKFMRLTENYLDGVDIRVFDELGENGLTINTRLIKARKVRVVDPAGSLTVLTSDSSGISVRKGLLEGVIGE